MADGADEEVGLSPVPVSSGRERATAAQSPCLGTRQGLFGVMGMFALATGTPERWGSGLLAPWDSRLGDALATCWCAQAIWALVWNAGPG